MNIEQRGGLWYAVVMVPKDLRTIYGVKFIQSLQTHDKLKAEVKAIPIVTKWKQEIKEARKQGNLRVQSMLSHRTPLGPLLSEWEADSSMGGHAVEEARQDLERLVSHFQVLEAITPRAARLWVDALAAAGYAHSSVSRILRSCTSFWAYLEKTSANGLERSDPFVGIIPRGGSKLNRLQ